MAIFRDVHCGRHRGVTQTLSSLAVVLFLAGYAACFMCDLETCCEDAHHADEDVCACACAYHILVVVDGPSLSPDMPVGFGIHELTHELSSAPVRRLFHPPRFSA
jgi:hypothetical protein